jgi:Skp family chaperone for outer membrane proteins
MTKKLAILGGASVFALAAVASIAVAQAKAPAAAPIVQGPPIPGMCVISTSRAITTSTVGQYVSGRLKQIGAQVDAELGPENTTLGTDVRALEAAHPTLDAATYQTRGQALQTRITAFRQKADLRQREVQATEQKAINRIAQELDPIVQSLYQQRRCSVLFDTERGAVINANPEMDLTAQAVTQLNGKITQFPFEREHLDTAGAAAAPAR